MIDRLLPPEALATGTVGLEVAVIVGVVIVDVGVGVSVVIVVGTPLLGS